MIIVNYHNIVERAPSAFSKLARRWDTRKAVDRQIQLLATRYRVVPLDAMTDAIRNGRSIPRGCAITFDDGYLGAYQFGLPILEQYGVPATFFFITRTIHSTASPSVQYSDRLEARFELTRETSLDLTEFGCPHLSWNDDQAKAACVKAITKKIKVTPVSVKEHLDRSINQQLRVPEDCLDEHLQQEAYQMVGWSQVADLLQRGFQVGSHTRTHASLSQVDASGLESEILGSYQDLTRRLNLESIPFAYPYGKHQHISEAAMLLAERVGYSCGLTTIKALNTSATGLFELRRIRFKDLTKPHRTANYAFDSSTSSIRNASS